MKKKFIIYILTFILLAYTSVVYAAGIPSAVKKLSASTVKITLSNDLNTKSITGLISGKNSDYIITRAHALEGYNGDIVVSYGDTSTNASFVMSDAKRDIALLQISEKFEGTRSVRIKNKEINSDVFIVNYNSVNDPESISQGNILDTLELTMGDSLLVNVYSITSPVSRDADSAALSDKHGNLAGICIYDGDTTTNKAITSEEICKVFDENGIPYKKATLLYFIIILSLILLALLTIAYFLYRMYAKKQAEKPVIYGLSGDFAGVTIPVTSESINIGRDAKCCQVVIMNNNKVSRCHCSIQFDNIKNMFVLTDLSSTHGTFIDNNKKLEPNVPVYLTSGSIFFVGDGNTSFKVQHGGDAV